MKKAGLKKKSKTMDCLRCKTCVYDLLPMWLEPCVRCDGAECYERDYKIEEEEEDDDETYSCTRSKNV